MDPNPPELPEPANLRFLRVLVTVLTAVMIGGVLLIIGLMVLRLQQPSVSFPDQIELPDGVRATAFTQTATHYAIVTEDNEILIYDRKSQSLSKRITLD